ncbi:MAG TPA: SDR family oxidoreductase [Mycobacteriales bacterium]|jgi:NAD(P)-dependent dehydrogenase (short-subunit alcohol dehydrogenase family)
MWTATCGPLDEFGRIDHHHLNAGIVGSFAPLPELAVEDFDRVLAVNLRGVLLGLRAAFRQYAAQGSIGNVVLTASIASLRGSADILPYQISKHGVLGALRGAAMYGGPLGIRVNAVAPGIVPTGSDRGRLDLAHRPGDHDPQVRRHRRGRRAQVGDGLPEPADLLLQPADLGKVAELAVLGDGRDPADLPDQRGEHAVVGERRVVQSSHRLVPPTPALCWETSQRGGPADMSRGTNPSTTRLVRSTTAAGVAA